MSIISSINVKKRIMALALIPMLAFLVFAVISTVSSIRERLVLSDVSVAIKYIRTLAPLINELQEEQVATNLYIEADSSNSSSALSSLNQAQNKTNVSLNEFKKFIEENESAILSIFEEKTADVNRLKTRLGHLDLMRRVASAKVDHSDDYKSQFDGQTIWVKVDIIRLKDYLISTLGVVAKYASAQDDLSRLSNAYFMLSQTQSAAMAFNSTVINATYQDKLDAYWFGQIMNYRALENNFLSLFFSYADDESLNSYNKNFKENGLRDRYESLMWSAFDSMNNVKESKYVPNDSGYVQLLKNVEIGYATVNQDLLNIIDKTNNELYTKSTISVVTTLIFVIALIIIISIICFAIINSILTPISSITSLMQEVGSRKDLSLRLQNKGNDELAKLSNDINTMLDHFSDAIEIVINKSNQTKEKIVSGVEQMNTAREHTDDQAREVDSIASAIQQMSVNNGEVSKIALNTATAVQKAHELSVGSEDAWKTCEKQLNDLNQGLNDAENAVTQLNEETGKINLVLDLIQSIAEQTNLLALNAAIEAARAGEAGKGFAVVADEVRALATKTAEATGKIRTQFEVLVKHSQSAGETMQNLQTVGSQSISLIQESSESISQIRGELDQINEMTTTLATATEEHSSVSKEISNNIINVKTDSDNLRDATLIVKEDMDRINQDSNDLIDYLNQFKV